MGKLDKHIIINRLAKIKYLYKIGIEQSMQVEAFAGFSILSFHDCAEMFLLLVAEDHGDKTEPKSFMDYWNKFPDLTLYEPMNSLKERRRVLKHKGIFPSKDDIEESRVTITQFFRENTAKIFGIDFDTILLADLIEYSNIKEYVQNAETALNQGDMYECLLNAKIGFEELLLTYESDKKQWYNSIFNIGEEVGTGYEHLVPRKEINKSRWFEQVRNTTNAVRNVLKISALGIDYKKYVFFNFITPKITVACAPTGGKMYLPEPEESFMSNRSVKLEDCQFSVNFVIDCALKFKEFDFDIQKYLR